MLIKEYFNIVNEIWRRVKDPCKFELLFIKTTIKTYINEFNLKTYLKKIIFQENILLNIFLLFFVFRIIYDFFLFIFYILDLYITFFFKWFFLILYISLDKWETYIFKKIHEFRKDPIKSKLYKREKALLAKSRAKYFKRFAIDFNNEYKICLKFDKHNYSIILKYYKYFSILIPSFFKWFKYSIRTNIPYLWRQLNSWISTIIIKSYRYSWMYIKFFSFKIFFKILKITFISRLIIKIIFFKTYYYLRKKLGIYYIAYNIRKQNRLQFYKFLYINYFFFYKKKNFIQNEFLILNEKELNKYTNQAMSLTFNFYSFNFKFIYFWHCYIKEISYINYLEYYLLKQKYYNFRNCRILIPFNIFRLLKLLSYFFAYIIPIFDKYYIKYIIILKTYFFKYFFKIISFLTYIFLPFVFIICLYKNIKEFFKFFNLFIKILFKNFK